MAQRELIFYVNLWFSSLLTMSESIRRPNFLLSRTLIWVISKAHGSICLVKDAWSFSYSILPSSHWFPFQATWQEARTFSANSEQRSVMSRYWLSWIVSSFYSFFSMQWSELDSYAYDGWSFFQLLAWCQSIRLSTYHAFLPETWLECLLGLELSSTTHNLLHMLSCLALSATWFSTWWCLIHLFMMLQFDCRQVLTHHIRSVL